jgi:catechol 2,3-dioxygenase-like lactoylglutathione lyase family enzyme
LALANGTLPSLDLSASRRFYEEVLGLEVRSEEHDKLVIRLGNQHTYLVEPVPREPAAAMVLLNHNGFYLAADQSVDEAHAAFCRLKAEHGIRQITQPNWQHGYYAFFIQDRDANWWEFHHPPPPGPREDLTGGPQMSTEQSREWFAQRRRRLNSGSGSDRTDG